MVLWCCQRTKRSGSVVDRASKAAVIVDTRSKTEKKVKTTLGDVVIPKSFYSDAPTDAGMFTRHTCVQRGFDHVQLSMSDANVPAQVEAGSLFSIMQCQNDLAEFLIKQQSLSALPSMNIPVYSGDPLEFIFFIRAFEHGVESKTPNDRDRLYFLEQFTQGQPKLGYLYGVVSTCLLTEATKRPRNDEMDSPSNMRTILSKLPFRWREKWRIMACEYQERTGRRSRFF